MSATHIELRTVRHLVALARRLSYSRAAEDLGLTQSALTRSIQALEQAAGMRLFDRDRAGVRLTAQGQVVFERASAFLADAENFERQLRQMARGEEGRIQFGMAPLPAWTLLPAALAERLPVAPGLVNDVVVRNVEALWPLLIAGEIEFFVSAEGQIPDAPVVRAETLGSFPLGLLVRDGHPLGAGSCSGVAFPILISGRGGSGGAMYRTLLGPLAGPTHMVNDYRTLVGLVRSTDAIWLSSPYAVADELEAGTVRELVTPKSISPQKIPIVLYSLDRRTQSTGLLMLKKAFRQRIRGLSHQFERRPIATYELQVAPG